MKTRQMRKRTKNDEDGRKARLRQKGKKIEQKSQ
jgi:hypothetical protein